MLLCFFSCFQRKTSSWWWYFFFSVSLLCFWRVCTRNFLVFFVCSSSSACFLYSCWKKSWNLCCLDMQNGGCSSARIDYSEGRLDVSKLNTRKENSVHFIDLQKSCQTYLSANGKTTTTIRSGTYNSRKNIMRSHWRGRCYTQHLQGFLRYGFLPRRNLWEYFLISSNFDRQETAALHWHWLWSMLQVLANSLHKPPLSNVGSVNFWVHDEKGERISACKNTFGWSIDQSESSGWNISTNLTCLDMLQKISP